jgi:hypothetical protein
MSNFADDKICDSIAECIKDRDFETAVSLLHLLALQAPGKAELFLEFVEMAKAGQS